MYSKLGKLMGFLSVLMTGIFCSLPAWAQEAATAAGQVAASAVPAAEPTGAAAPAAPAQTCSAHRSQPRSLR